MPNAEFDQNVFLNCPFDEDYEPILQAILFCLIRFGLTPRIASERSNAGESRVEKIFELIKESRYSIHDLSRCQAREVEEYYRLNMPFELGVDFGCKRFGRGRLQGKVILILEEQRHRYQAAISDLAGSDIESHSGKFEIAVRKVRNWLTDNGFEGVRAGRIVSEYEDFQGWYYERQLEEGCSDEDIQDYSTRELLRSMIDWVNQNSPRR